MPRPPVDLKNRNLALLLAWAFPGLGHFYQGRIGKGILYSVCISSLFLVGLVMGDWRVVYWRWQSPLANTESFCFPYIFQFWTGLMALPALIQSTLTWAGKDVILSGFMAAPTSLAEMSVAYPKRGKFVEIGVLYTMVAGLLNILAMYDAFEGPAHSDDSTTTEPAELATKTEAIEIGASV